MRGALQPVRGPAGWTLLALLAITGGPTVARCDPDTTATLDAAPAAPVIGSNGLEAPVPELA